MATSLYLVSWLDVVVRRRGQTARCQLCKQGFAGGEEMGSATGGAPSLGRRTLTCRGTASEVPRRAVELTLALLGDLRAPLRSPCSGPRTAARAGASRRFPRRTRSSCRSCPARGGERVVDLVERLGLHLDERELDVFLDVGFGALDRVEHFVQLAAPGPSSRTSRILPWTSACSSRRRSSSICLQFVSNGTRSSPAPLAFF